ncbi:MAG TPA: glycosyltransferase [Enhygromyxa sp.]|nr:glycosyltransferase [Enhygromyxa sp.]
MIPNVAHFIWFGAQLPWVYTLAVRSAARLGGFDRLIRHHADELARTPAWAELIEIPGFEARRLDTAALDSMFAALGRDGERLATIFIQLRAPAARANLLRALILAIEGGVYLDLDTVTVRSLEPLRRAHGAFCGEEHLVWPAALRRASGLGVRATALARSGVRDLHRRLPGGWRSFRRLEHLYPTAANNAVLGAVPGHPFVQRLIDGMLAVPEHRRLVRFALGTHLLQDTLARGREDDLAVLPPRAFYPLGPEISEHWFRIRRELPPLEQVIGADTLVVHWYASVRTRTIVPRIDAAYVREQADRQLFSALALRVLDGLG